MSKKEDYVRRMQVKLDEWETAIGELKAKIEKAEVGARARFREEVAELRAKQLAAGKKLDHLRHAGDAAWEELKTGVEAAWDVLGKAVRSAKDRFKAEGE